MATKSNSPLIVIVGPTASGKSALAMKIAQEYNGEIICADSRTIYKGMDIGTAKPSQWDQLDIPHWGLDLVAPGEYFSAADFKRYAEQKIHEIRVREHMPILVGGTGLYIDSVLFNFKFDVEANFDLRGELEKMTLPELYDYCKKHNVIVPENDKNKRYIIRAIERNNVPKKRNLHLLNNTIVVGIAAEKEILRTRIEQRTEQLFEDGVVDEAKNLGEMYGWGNTAMTGNIYPLIHLYLQDKMSLDDVKEKFITLDWRLAKRQLTWLRRNQFIHWFSLEEAKTFIDQQLANR